MENQKLQYSKPAYYSISVSGDIREDQLEIIMNFYTGEMIWKKDNHRTYLEGWLKDQIALSGLLNYLTDLHYLLLSVASIDDRLYSETADI